MSLPRSLAFFVCVLAFVVFALACDRHPSTSLAPPSTFDANPETIDASPPTFDAGDLASDLAARTSDACALFGPVARFVTVGDTFLFVAPDGGSLFDPSVALARRALAAFYAGRFEHRPSRAVTVLVFSSTPPYDAYCERLYHERCGSTWGAYQKGSRTIALDASHGTTTLTHELVHPLVEADFPMAPPWLDEGLGALYEAPAFPSPGEIRGAGKNRLPRLLRALASPEEAPHVTLEALLTMPRDDFHGGDENLHYSMARFACMWLETRGALWTVYRAWRDGFWDDLTGEKTFTRVVGRTPEEANAEWVAWVRGL